MLRKIFGGERVPHAQQPMDAENVGAKPSGQKNGVLESQAEVIAKLENLQGQVKALRASEDDSRMRPMADVHRAAIAREGAKLARQLAAAGPDAVAHQEEKIARQLDAIAQEGAVKNGEKIEKLNAAKEKAQAVLEARRKARENGANPV